nr:hypothetical protein [Thermus scotoductus]
MEVKVDAFLLALFQGLEEELPVDPDLALAFSGDDFFGGWGVGVVKGLNLEPFILHLKVDAVVFGVSDQEGSLKGALEGLPFGDEGVHGRLSGEDAGVRGELVLGEREAHASVLGLQDEGVHAPGFVKDYGAFQGFEDFLGLIGNKVVLLHMALSGEGVDVDTVAVCGYHPNLLFPHFQKGLP